MDSTLAEATEMAEHNLGLLDSGKYSDLSIICGTATFRAHRAIVCPQTPYSTRACDGDFKEGKELTITLHDETPCDIARMVLYLYTKSYPENVLPLMMQEDRLFDEILQGAGPTIISHVTIINDCVIHANMYAIGEKYMIDGLKRLSLKQYKLAATSVAWGPLGPGLYASARTIYGTIPEHASDIRRMLVYTLQSKRHRTGKHEDAFKKLLEDTPELAIDLLTKCREKKFIYCRRCRQPSRLEDYGCGCGMTGQCEEYKKGLDVENVCCEICIDSRGVGPMVMDLEGVEAWADPEEGPEWYF